MNEMISQVGDLLLGAVPTAILFVLLVLAYRFLVQGPLSATLAERRARTTGAVEKAAEAISAAAAKSDEYAERLRRARTDVFRMREQRLQQWSRERESVLAEARQAAGVRIQAAKSALETEAASARQQLAARSEELAAEVIRVVVPVAAGGAR